MSGEYSMPGCCFCQLLQMEMNWSLCLRWSGSSQGRGPSSFCVWKGVEEGGVLSLCTACFTDKQGLRQALTEAGPGKPGSKGGCVITLPPPSLPLQTTTQQAEQVCSRQHMAGQPNHRPLADTAAAPPVPGTRVEHAGRACSRGSPAHLRAPRVHDAVEIEGVRLLGPAAAAAGARSTLGCRCCCCWLGGLFGWPTSCCCCCCCWCCWRCRWCCWLCDCSCLRWVGGPIARQVDGVTVGCSNRCVGHAVCGSKGR